MPYCKAYADGRTCDGPGQCSSPGTTAAPITTAPTPPPAVPKTCISWFDGCNTCSVADGKIKMCTLMYCFVKGMPYCKAYADGRTCDGPGQCSSPGTTAAPITTA